MLVTRQCDTGRNTWSSSKLEAIYNTASPRMSNFDALPSQPDWREQYSGFPLSGDNSLVPTTFEQNTSLTISENTQDQQSQGDGSRSAQENRDNLESSRQESQPKIIIDKVDSVPGICSNLTENPARDESLIAAGSTALSLGPIVSNPLSSEPSTPTIINDEVVGEREIKDEDEDLEDDDEMVDAELEEGGLPKTAAERRAERRKMKRFRLTHQQTRFLMSEFAKQAHPDAAHRERLSREIPGLSPRQVQVWFQNRRAKIKRLTADDRERMMKMRALPDDFDNVQALHSPYGAVHRIGTPMQSPVEFVPTYEDHLMRPLMVDTVRRSDHDEHMSSTSLSPAFSHLGFNPNAPIGTPDVLSPLSLNPTDRYYGNHLSAPLSAGPRSSNFDRQNSYQTVPQSSHSRHHIRPLQPLQLRETMSRSRSETIQSPLRSSMSWKGETLDYSSYQSGQPSPQMGGRDQLVYQQELPSGNNLSGHQYDPNTYSNTDIANSPTSIYSSTHGTSSSLQQSSPSTIPRIRASSSTAFPRGLDIRNQYRVPGQSPTNGAARSSSFAGAFAGGYGSAPLTAHVDFTLPRTPIDASHNRDYNVPQLSAPMVSSQDFPAGYNSSLSPGRIEHADRKFSSPIQSNQDLNVESQTQENLQEQAENNGDANYLRPGDYETNGQKPRRNSTITSSFESP